jgi:hypothetical protein
MPVDTFLFLAVKFQSVISFFFHSFSKGKMDIEANPLAQTFEITTQTFALFYILPGYYLFLWPLHLTQL